MVFMLLNLNQSFLCNVLSIIASLAALFLLAIVLSVLLKLIGSNFSFGILELIVCIRHIWNVCTENHSSYAKFMTIIMQINI